MGFRVSGFGFGVSSDGVWVSDFRIRVSDLGFRVSGYRRMRRRLEWGRLGWGVGLRADGESWVQDLVFKVEGAPAVGVRVKGILYEKTFILKKSGN